eukprot:3839781-Rhodomonas_salina.1
MEVDPALAGPQAGHRVLQTAISDYCDDIQVKSLRLVQEAWPQVEQQKQHFVPQCCRGSKSPRLTSGLQNLTANSSRCFTGPAWTLSTLQTKCRDILLTALLFTHEVDVLTRMLCVKWDKEGVEEPWKQQAVILWVKVLLSLVHHVLLLKLGLNVTHEPNGFGPKVG